MARRLLGLALLAAAIPACVPSADDVGGGDEQGQVTVRASVQPFGDEEEGSHLNPSVSADGRFVAFQSDSTDLDEGTVNPWIDVFVKDRLTGEIDNLTYDPDGEGNPAAAVGPYLDDATDPSISGDGEYVAFVSHGQFANGTFPPSTYPQSNAFVIHRRTRVRRGVTDLLWPDEHITSPAISGDGRYVAWVSGGDLLGYVNAGNVPQIYRSDMSGGSPTWTLVSHATGAPATVANAVCGSPRISADGRFIVFHSAASNLVAGDANGVEDCFIWDAMSNTVSRVSLDTGGGSPDNASVYPAVSDDGRYVAYQTYADDVIAAETDVMIVRRDRMLNVNELVARRPYNISIAFPSGDPCSISGDGRYVAFTSPNSALTPVPLTRNQVFVADMGAGGGLLLASRNAATGASASEECFHARISKDGRWVAWDSDAPNLVPGDTNTSDDVFLRGPLN